MTTARTLEKDVELLGSIADECSTWDEFRKRICMSHLMDLSNREEHRFGRALTVYPDAPVLTIAEVAQEHELVRYPQSVGPYSEMRRQIVAVGTGRADTVKIYRGGLPDGKVIETGDFVALDRRYAEGYIESEWRDAGFDEREVPAEDVVWGDADYTEWVYSPKEFREKVGVLEQFYYRRKQQDLAAEGAGTSPDSVTAAPKSPGA